jgi:UDP-glucose 4-epimerase
MTNSTTVNAVVFGAGGFLGGALAKSLANSGYQTLACSRKPIPSLANLPNLRFAYGDTQNEAFLRSVLPGTDVLYHFASSTYPSLNFENAKAEFDEALAPLFNLIQVAADVKVKKIVFPSSGGTIYAEQVAARTEESHTNPRTPYAIFKLAAESLLLHAADQGKFTVDIFRIANPYGPGQYPRPGQGVIPHWLSAILKRQPLTIFGDGTAARDYVFVDDFCKLVGLSMTRLEQNDVFNLGTGIATSLNELLEILRSQLNTPIIANYSASRAVDQTSVSLSACKLLMHVPGFQFVSVAEGVAKTLRALGIADKFPITNEVASE